MDMSASKMQKSLKVKDEIDEKDTSENKLYVGLSPFMNFAFGFTEVAVLSSIAVTLEFGLGMALIINNAKKMIFTIVTLILSLQELVALLHSSGLILRIRSLLFS